MAHPIFELLARLDDARLYYVLSRHRPDSILVSITFVGMRVEVDVFDDGHMEVCRFCGSESVEGDHELISKIIQDELD